MTSFRRWIRQFMREDSAMGDLARDVRADPEWPAGPGSLAAYEAHLEDCGADPEALDTLRDAWRRYERAEPGQAALRPGRGRAMTP